MEASNIPRFFWISLSFCMVVATLGLLGIAFQSATVSIEIADAKITMSSVLADVKEIRSGLELENMILLKEKEALENLLTELRRTGDDPKKILQTYLMDITLKGYFQERTDRLKDLDVKIKSMEKIIRQNGQMSVD